MRWCTLRNTCDGVEESQAKGWFAAGCRHGSVLWQRLQRDMPETLAEVIRVADSYALGDPTQPAMYDHVPAQQPSDGAGTYRRQDRQEFRHKRKENRYGSYHVAAVEQGPKPKKQKPSSDWSFENMLDQPCSFHTAAGGKPAGHTTRNCSRMS